MAAQQSLELLILVRIRAPLPLFYKNILIEVDHRSPIEKALF